MRTLMKAVYDNAEIRSNYAKECLKEGFMFNPSTFKEDEKNLDNRAKEALLSALQANKEGSNAKVVGSYIELKRMEKYLYNKSRETTPVILGAPNAHKVLSRFIKAIYKNPPTVKDYLWTHFLINPEGIYQTDFELDETGIEVLLEDVWIAKPSDLRKIRDIFSDDDQETLLRLSKMKNYY